MGVPDLPAGGEGGTQKKAGPPRTGPTGNTRYQGSDLPSCGSLPAQPCAPVLESSSLGHQEPNCDPSLGAPIMRHPPSPVVTTGPQVARKLKCQSKRARERARDRQTGRRICLRVSWSPSSPLPTPGSARTHTPSALQSHTQTDIVTHRHTDSG